MIISSWKLFTLRATLTYSGCTRGAVMLIKYLLLSDRMCCKCLAPGPHSQPEEGKCQESTFINFGSNLHFVASCEAESRRCRLVGVSNVVHWTIVQGQLKEIRHPFIFIPVDKFDERNAHSLSSC